MAENLSKRPPKGILKSSSSFDNPDVPRPSKETKWDEMNIIATLHPPEKDYGHMKIDEPKTPYNYEGLQAEFDFDQLDSTAVAAKLAEGSKPKIFEESSEDEDEKETLEERGNLFNLKFAVKELERNSKKCEKEEKVEKAKIKKAIQKGNMEGARIHAENAIRQRNQALNYLRMSARVDAVASRVQTALTTRKVTQSMAGVVKAMDAAMKSMNLEKISGLMDKFESQFEDLDVQSSYMENAMSQTTTTNIPQNDVDSLLQQVADEAGLELNMELPSGQLGSIGTSTVSQEQDELTQRLARLRE
ncbi:hypothetical protein E2986_13711 [Frieseomelitta varia]|uniref:Charged multivesicular body protein 1b n=1 Tax=Frieseomelitta varia TaxID=561572 RepID=A0A833RZF6_9HYME|nr:hypothetical protein E2986_13711 [Frieseomelitta varia]